MAGKKKIAVETIKRLREETGAPVIRVKKVLEEFDGDEKKAHELLTKEGFEKATKRAERETREGRVFSYIHHSGKIGVMVEVLCETDFVARNELFGELGKNMAMQIAFSDPKNKEDLLAQEFIKDPSKKMADLVKAVIAKTGENVRVGNFSRLQI